MNVKTITILALITLVACKKQPKIIDVSNKTAGGVQTDTVFFRMSSGFVDLDLDNDNVEDLKFTAYATVLQRTPAKKCVSITILNSDFTFSGTTIQDTLYKDTLQMLYMGTLINTIRHHNETNGINIKTINKENMVDMYDSSTVLSASYSPISDSSGILFTNYSHLINPPYEYYTHKLGEEKNGFILLQSQLTNITYKIYIEVDAVALYVYPPSVL